jgi:hypothetical protein
MGRWVLAEVLIFGLTCPECRSKVSVLASDKSPNLLHAVDANCKFGYHRIIALQQLQTLEVWRLAEEKSA